ncbi:MAG: hopanoid biosynthesis-associated protein HpnK [Desulfobacteraceae bacterium]|nr:hopanoid biosynthesis-associated protein HpnK [Desulfobacteraceae bacterium]
MGKKYLIVNADDFGTSRSVNEAVILAHRCGMLTSTSLMPGGGAFAEAVRLARENPRLGVGIHVTCVLGKSVLPHAEIPHIVDPDGNFPSDPALAGLRYFFCKTARKELFKEVSAQFEKFSASGLSFSHADSHCHLHVHPVVLDAMVRICGEYGVKSMRVPADDFFAALPFIRGPFGKAAHAVIFKLLTGSMKKVLRASGIAFPLTTYGHFVTGAAGREYVLSILNRVRDGASEINFHPDVLQAGAHVERIGLQRFRELRILLDPEIRARMKELGIIPATYFDLDRI